MNDPAAVADGAAGAFARLFGAEPRWVSLAPGRVNLIGEHTDYNSGFVLPIAIDRWCAAGASPAGGSRSRLRAHDVGESAEVSLRELAERGPGAREKLPKWARYAAGSIVEHARGMGLATPPELDLLFTSTVPFGSGLSSSAALETACAVALELATGTKADPLTRAIDCQRAEHRWSGVPCGLMDQLASSCGRAGHALLIDCRDNTVTPVPMPPPDEAVLLVVNTGVHHDLGESEYPKRRRACEQAAVALGVPTLREIGSLAEVEWDRLDEEQSRCVRHVVSENGRVLEAVGALRAGDLTRLGRLMHESHDSLRDDYRVSCRELDAVVEIASAQPGVFGARMTGGGFGGCAVVLARPDGARKLTHDLPEAYRRGVRRECTVEPVHAVAGGVSATEMW